MSLDLALQYLGCQFANGKRALNGCLLVFSNIVPHRPLIDDHIANRVPRVKPLICDAFWFEWERGDSVYHRHSTVNTLAHRQFMECESASCRLPRPASTITISAQSNCDVHQPTVGFKHSFQFECDFKRVQEFRETR
jgi:hypothetical protein